MGSPPLRSCVGCGRTREKRYLLRLTTDGHSVRIDPKGRLPGRGFYVCRSVACVALAEKRKGLARWVGGAEAEAVFRALREAVGAPGEDREEKLLGMIGLFRRAGRVEVGLKGSLEGMARGEGRLLVTARDISERGAAAATRAAAEANVPHLIVGSRVALGAALGAGETVAALVLDQDGAKGMLDLAGPAGGSAAEGPPQTK